MRAYLLQGGIAQRDRVEVGVVDPGTQLLDGRSRTVCRIAEVPAVDHRLSPDVDLGVHRIEAVVVRVGFRVGLILVEPHRRHAAGGPEYDPVGESSVEIDGGPVGVVVDSVGVGVHRVLEGVGRVGNVDRVLLGDPVGVAVAVGRSDGTVVVDLVAYSRRERQAAAVAVAEVLKKQTLTLDPKTIRLL